MKINTLRIEGVGGIKNLELVFNQNMNILCGPNGIGKTTILEIIAHVFSNGNTNVLKRNVSSDISKISTNVTINGELLDKEIEFNNFIPEVMNHISGFYGNSNELISLKTTRTFQYTSLQSVSKDSSKEKHILWNDAMYGVDLTDIKNWFVNRYLYSPHPRALTEEQIENFNLAKRCFSFLNKDFTFSRVDASSNEILVNTPNGEIYYEYLSSGFKSILSILFGIIKEIEFRFKDPRINAKNFSGIILIDEIELHLHPEWQEKIIEVLSLAFPLVQFFITTHSPHVIQTAKPYQIIALGFDNDIVAQRTLSKNQYGFQGWTIEEVLTDVMGMPNIRTQLFSELTNSFQNEIECENFESAEIIYQEIDKMLHPENHLRKLFKFQLAGIRK